MRVAYFAEIFPSTSETWVHHEIRELTRLGCEVRVFASWPRPELRTAEDAELASQTRYMGEFANLVPLRGLLALCRPRVLHPLTTGVLSEGVSVNQMGQIIRDFGRMAKMLSEVREFSPDITVCHFAGTRANFGLMLQLLQETPCVIKSHAKDIFGGSAVLATKVKLASRFYTISGYNIGFIAEHYPKADVKKIRLHRCGVPLDLFSFEPKSLNPSKTPPLLVSVGRLVPMKGYEFLIRAAQLVRDQHAGLRVIIAGQGPDEARLKNLIAQLGLEECVQMVGHCSPDEVRGHLQSASAFIMPCILDSQGETQDGIPVALMEAMACGVPVVSTRLSGIPELIEDGNSGFLAEPEDSQDLSRAIDRALAMSEGERVEMLTRARQVIERNHDARKLTHDLLVDLEAIVRQTSSDISP